MEDIIEKERKSFSYAAEGIIYALKSQVNFRIQLTIGAGAVILGYIFSFSRFEWIILLICICLVLFAELVNTVVEIVVDLAEPDIHPKAKIAKDAAAGLVLLISTFVLIVGLLLFVPHILKLF